MIICQRGGRYIARHFHQAERTTCSHSHVKQHTCRVIPSLSWKVSLLNNGTQTRDLSEPKANDHTKKCWTQPLHWIKSNWSEESNTILFPLQLIQQIRKEMFWGLEGRIVHMEISEKERKKSQYICPVNKHPHFYHHGGPGETCSSTGSS